MASSQSLLCHHRGFGAMRYKASGNYQASYKALDGSTQVAPQTFKTREAADEHFEVKQVESILGDQKSR
jgi:hypothetical protein